MNGTMRTLVLVGMLAAMGVAAGCSNKKKVSARKAPAADLTLTEQTRGDLTATTTQGGPATRPVEQIPVVIVQNDAVVQRDWPEQVFWRVNGDTVAGPTYWDSINKA